MGTVSAHVAEPREQLVWTTRGRVHLFATGHGPPVVLLHGLGSIALEMLMARSSRDPALSVGTFRCLPKPRQQAYSKRDAARQKFPPIRRRRDTQIWSQK